VPAALLAPLPKQSFVLAPSPISELRLPDHWVGIMPDGMNRRFEMGHAKSPVVVAGQLFEYRRPDEQIYVNRYALEPVAPVAAADHFWMIPVAPSSSLTNNRREP